jgi:hypothetical protein
LAAAHHPGHFGDVHDVLSTLVYFVLAYKFVFAFGLFERDEHRIGAPVGRQLAPECERARIVLFLGFRMFE